MSIVRSLRRDLSRAMEEMSIRGLTLSSKWAGEMLMGMPDDIDVEYDEDIEVEHIPPKERGVIGYARALMVAGEYRRSAHVLRGHKGGVKSNVGVFQLCYSLYMAGEKIKTQAAAENTTSSNSPVNPLLGDVRAELLPMYKNSLIDGNDEMDPHLMFILGIVLRDMRAAGSPQSNTHCDPCPLTILMESARRYPYNWSCWLEIADSYVSSGNPVAPLPAFPPFLLQLSHCLTGAAGTTNSLSVGERDVPAAVFLAHLLVEQHKGTTALSILDQLQPVLPNSLPVLTQVALAHYGLREYEEAQAVFERVHAADPHRLDQLDTYSNILYVKERRAELSHLAHICVKVDKYRAETCCVIGNYYSLKGQHDKAVLSFQRALKVNRRYLSAWTLMGHEYVELRNTSAAVQCYRRAVDVDPSDYRAWYGLGQTYEMLHLLQYGLHYYKRAAALHPGDARMWSAVGSCLARLTAAAAGSTTREAVLRAKREAISAYERAVACNDREGLATRELARLYREMGDSDRAAVYYSKHLASREQGNGEMADSVVDGDAAEGLLFLATHAYGQGDAATAEKHCLRLVGYRGPEGAEAKSILREIRHALHHTPDRYEEDTDLVGSPDEELPPRLSRDSISGRLTRSSQRRDQS